MSGPTQFLSINSGVRCYSMVEWDGIVLHNECELATRMLHVL